MLICVEGDFENTRIHDQSIATDLRQCLIFFPSVVFVIMVDAQILYSIKKYEPVAFNDVPYRWSKPMMLFIATISLMMTVVCYIFCIIVFGGLSNNTHTR